MKQGVQIQKVIRYSNLICSSCGKRGQTTRQENNKLSLVEQKIWKCMNCKQWNHLHETGKIK